MQLISQFSHQNYFNIANHVFYNTRFTQKKKISTPGEKNLRNSKFFFSSILKHYPIFKYKSVSSSCFHPLWEALTQKGKRHLEIWAWGRSPRRQERKTEQHEVHRTMPFKVLLMSKQASCTTCIFFREHPVAKQWKQPFELSAPIQEKGIKEHFLLLGCSYLKFLWDSLNG